MKILYLFNKFLASSNEFLFLKVIPKKALPFRGKNTSITFETFCKLELFKEITWGDAEVWEILSSAGFLNVYQALTGASDGGGI